MAALARPPSRKPWLIPAGPKCPSPPPRAPPAARAERGHAQPRPCPYGDRHLPQREVRRPRRDTTPLAVRPPGRAAEEEETQREEEGREEELGEEGLKPVLWVEVWGFGHRAIHPSTYVYINIYI